MTESQEAAETRIKVAEGQLLVHCNLDQAWASPGGYEEEVEAKHMG